MDITEVMKSTVHDSATPMRRCGCIPWARRKTLLNILMPSFEWNLLIQWHQLTSLETRDSRLSYGEDPESLSDLGLVRYRVVTPQTDGQTDRQTDK